MRLLNAKALVHDGKWELGEFSFGHHELFAPPYAILSHTWGAEGEEILLEDIEDSEESDTSSLKEKSGFAKIHGLCAQAIKDEIDWVWIDTCCISRVDDMEQSEAVNSTYSWYRQAVVCYVHLSDVPSPENHEAKDSAFRQSRWFKRAWTLPELLAPHDVRFFSASWDDIGAKADFVGDFPTGRESIGDQHHWILTEPICEITGISRRFLSDPLSVYDSSVAERMSWAAGREATREEDQVYSLMGLLDIRLPVEYGIGFRIAFRGLQGEIIKRYSTDPSILAWGVDTPLEALSMPSPESSGPSYLAPSPDAFRGPRWDTYFRRRDHGGFPVRYRQEHVQVRAMPLGEDYSCPYYLGLLGCQGPPRGNANVIAFLLRVETTPDGPPMAYRVQGSASFSLGTTLYSCWCRELNMYAEWIRLSPSPRPVGQVSRLELPCRQLYDAQIESGHGIPAGKYQFLDCFPPLEAYDDPPPGYDSTQILLRFSAPFDDNTDTDSVIDKNTKDTTVLLIWLKLGAAPQMAITKEEGTAVEFLLWGKRLKETLTHGVCFDYLKEVGKWYPMKRATPGRPSVEFKGPPSLRGN